MRHYLLLRFVSTAFISTFGAIGVSGAPDGDKDELCAQQALDKMSDHLNFVE